MTDCCCRKPEQLKTVPEGCTREQIDKCHGQTDGHPCVEPEKSEKD
jgi:hypothetical protein